MVTVNISITNNGSSDLVNFEISSLNGELIRDFQIPYNNLTPFGVRIEDGEEIIYPKLPGGKYYASCEAFVEGLKVLSSNTDGEYSFYYSPISHKAYALR